MTTEEILSKLVEIQDSVTKINYQADTPSVIAIILGSLGLAVGITALYISKQNFFTIY